MTDSVNTAAGNMDFDNQLALKLGNPECDPVLRIYCWQSTAVTVGHFENIARDVAIDYCRDNDIEIARRPTGGRGILHGSDITITFVVPFGFWGDRIPSVKETYETLSASMESGLNGLGVATRLGHCERLVVRTGDCFAISTGADRITSSGDKLVGSAQRRYPNGVLMQSSVRWRKNKHKVSDVFPGGLEPSTYPLESIELAALVDAMVNSVESAFGVSF